MICEKCGSEMLETNKFCGICGTPNPLHPEAAEAVREYGSSEQEPEEAKETETAVGKAKVKRTCSLSAVIFCGVVIFILSVTCGVFAGLYFSARSAPVNALYSTTQYDSGGGMLTW